MIKTAVILAAGFGKRLKLYEKPKGFLNISGQYLIEYSIQALIACGIQKIIIGTGFKSEFYDNLKSIYPQIVTRKNEDFTRTGSLKTLQLLADLIDGDFLLLESDILYDAHCLNNMIALPQKNVLLLAESPNEKDGVYVDVDEMKNLIRMKKDREHLANPLEGILVGITKMSFSTFERIIAISDDLLSKNPYEHYDFSFEHLSKTDPFFVYDASPLIFTEVDDDEQLHYALTAVYPKLTLPLKRYQEKGGLRSC